jgi:alpha-tubulin suppressor-like RCC1 family protein
MSKIPLSVQGISASIEHTLAWTKEGLLYSWGDASDGKLGRDIDQLGFIGV